MLDDNPPYDGLLWSDARWPSAISGSARAEQLPTAQPATVVTNIQQLRGLDFENAAHNDHAIRLEGTVWWANPTQGKLVLDDDTGAAMLETDLHGQTVQPGERVRLEGTAQSHEQRLVFELVKQGR